MNDFNWSQERRQRRAHRRAVWREQNEKWFEPAITSGLILIVAAGCIGGLILLLASIR